MILKNERARLHHDTFLIVLLTTDSRRILFIAMSQPLIDSYFFAKKMQPSEGNSGIKRKFISLESSPKRKRKNEEIGSRRLKVKFVSLCDRNDHRIILI